MTVNALVLLRNFIRLISRKDATSCSPRKCLIVISRITSLSETLKILKTALLIKLSNVARTDFLWSVSSTAYKIMNFMDDSCRVCTRPGIGNAKSAPAVHI